MDPYRAIVNVVAAHSTLHRRQGFSPSQWVFGRGFSIEGRLFESEQNLPLLQSQVSGRHGFGQSLNLRMQAEEAYRRSQASSQLSRLLNMRTRPQRKFLPGDLVYYRREKVPADRPAHPTLSIPKSGMGRWYGPGRVHCLRDKE